MRNNVTLSDIPNHAADDESRPRPESNHAPARFSRPLALGPSALLLAAALWAWPAAADGDERWDFRFAPPGTDGPVLAATWWQENLYIGGAFRAAGQARAISVARWDATNYWPLGEGLASDSVTQVPVYALAGFGEELFAGGVFTRSGTNLLSGLARWDGTNWSPVGGATGVVYTLTVVDDALWVAGSLGLPGDTNLCGLAKWDGANWLSDGRATLACSNCDARIESVAVNGAEVFVAGMFSWLNGLAISNHARWDGANWIQISCGANEAVYSFAVHEGTVYACGSFTTIDGVTAANVARWDGASWSPLGTGLDDECYRLHSADTNLFALGDFAHAGDVPAEKLARWDGAAWHALGDSLWNPDSGDQPYVLATDDAERLYLGGHFQNVQGQPAAHFAMWDQEGWHAVAPVSAFGTGGGVGLVRALAASEDAVYAGGFFEQAGRTPAFSIARFHEQDWSPLAADFANGSFSHINAVAVQSTNLFVGGSFTKPGIATNLTRWDGQDWWPVGGDVNSNVFALAVSGTHLFAGGTFTRIGEVDANHVACWDGFAWSPLGDGVNASVTALCPHEGRLYAGGGFSMAGEVPASRIARWDGSEWQALGSGVSSEAGEPRPQVSAIAVTGSNVYVGGRFTLAGGQPANNIAMWNGTDWSPLGSGETNGVQGIVSALAVHGHHLFVGGFFTNAGGFPALSLARWDGTNWSTLGSGLEWGRTYTPRVYALALQRDDLWVGGIFTHAGLKPAANLARWTVEPAVRLAPPEALPGHVRRLRTTGVAGLRFRLEATSDFNDWSTLATGQGDTDTFEVIDAAPSAARFYRSVLVP